MSGTPLVTALLDGLANAYTRVDPGVQITYAQGHAATHTHT